MKRPQALAGRRPKAVLFDLDGTLYAQGLLRGMMAVELLPLFVRPGWTELRALSTFRRVREKLRSERPAGGERLERLQFVEAARVAGCEPARLQALIEEWMFRRPLKYLRLCRRAGIQRLLEHLHSQGIPAGLLSDYPVADKIRALGLDGRFSLMLSTTDPEIDAFKPHPRGFEHACAQWALEPRDVLYVGDRPEVDAVGAANAGMTCWIVSSAPIANFATLLSAVSRCAQ